MFFNYTCVCIYLIPYYMQQYLQQTSLKRSWQKYALSPLLGYKWIKYACWWERFLSFKPYVVGTQKNGVGDDMF